MIIHNDAVSALQSGGLGDFDVGYDADAHDHQVGVNLFVSADHAADLAVALECIGGGVDQDLDASAGMELMVELAHFLGSHPLQNPGLHLEYGYLLAGRAGHGGNFQADIAAPDDADLFSGFHGLANGIHIGNRAQVMDAFQVAARDVRIRGLDPVAISSFP